MPPDPVRRDVLPDRVASALWSTPYASSDGPTRWLHVKTTPKRVEVKLNERAGYTDRFDRSGDLPEGAIGWKSGFHDGRLVLFEDRAACLRFMAQRARDKADRLDAQAAKLRANADRWGAEAESARPIDERKAT